MAYVLRTYCSFDDFYFHEQWLVEIYEEDYAGVSSIFTAGADPIQFRFGPSGDIDAPIKSREATVNIVQKQGEDYSWLITDDARKFKLIVKRGLYSNVDYYGYMLANEYINNLGYVQSISITFSDNLNLLSSWLFEPPALQYTGKDTILNQLATALLTTGLSLNINVANNLFETTMNMADSDDPFAQASTFRDLWLNDDYTSGTCDTVLKEHLQPFLCRIFQAKGEWWICRTREMVKSDIPYRKFTSAGVYISNSVLQPQIATKNILGVRNRDFLVFSGEMTFEPEWNYRNLEIDFGLRNSLITGFLQDSRWITDYIHRDWTNNGNLWEVNTGIGTNFIKGVADGSIYHEGNLFYFDNTKVLISPAVDIFTVNTYTLLIQCGRNQNKLIYSASAPILLLLTADDGSRYQYDDNANEWKLVTGVPIIGLTKINFPKVDGPAGSNLVTQSIDIVAPPKDGVVTINIYSPYKTQNTLLNNRNVYFYIGDIQFSSVNNVDSQSNGQIYNQVINVNAYTIPDPLRIRISDGAFASENLYFGGIYINDIPSVEWVHKDADSNETPLTLKEWIATQWEEQHQTVSKNYEGNFIGLAEWYSVIKIGEFDFSLFIWNDVTYSPKTCYWSGSVLELKPTKYPAELAPNQTLTSRSLPVSGNTTIVSSGASSPGGASPELQFNNNGDFTGTTDITFDTTNNRILKGGTVPLIAYTKQTVTVSAGETLVSFPVGTFVDGDEVGMDAAINGVTTDSDDPEIVWAIPYNITYAGFYIDFKRACTFTYDAFIKR